jgi:hypothetical protein
MIVPRLSGQGVGNPLFVAFLDSSVRNAAAVTEEPNATEIGLRRGRRRVRGHASNALSDKGSS